MRTFTSDVRIASEAGWAGAGDAVTRLLADSSCSTHVAGTGALPLRSTLFVRVAAGTRVTDALVHRSVLTVSIQTTVGNTDGWCYRCRNHNTFTLFSFTFKKLDRIHELLKSLYEFSHKITTEFKSREDIIFIEVRNLKFIGIILKYSYGKTECKKLEDIEIDVTALSS